MIVPSEEPGSIWQVFYYASYPIEIPERISQQHIDSQMNQSLYAAQPPVGATPEEIMTFFARIISNSRRDARQDIENASKGEKRFSVMVQVGNTECLQDLKSIQDHPSFSRWEDPNIIEFYRSL